MKVISPGDQPFTTSNAILAYCLHLAGVPWEKDTRAARVFYSVDILNRFKNGTGDPYYKGWELEKAVEHAHKTGRRGHVEYAFKRTERLSALLRAFSEQQRQLDEDTGYVHEVVSAITKLVYNRAMEQDVAMVRLACVLLKARSQFMDIWKGQVPIMIVSNPGRATHSTQMVETKDGLREARVVESPGFKAISLNASKETREHLGI
jgi:hypothetical protein